MPSFIRTTDYKIAKIKKKIAKNINLHIIKIFLLQSTANNSKIIDKKLIEILKHKYIMYDMASVKSNPAPNLKYCEVSAVCHNNNALTVSEFALNA